MLAQITRLQAVEALEKASKDTTTNKITTQSARIAQALVTNRLRGRFAIEVDKLGVAGLAIELQQAKTTAGVPFFQVRLINKPSEPVGKVLSEGEHRCVALAAFLAELSTIDAQSAIVFDDPVSSLDHLHRDRVAARLAEAGQSRQVVVFTHDMAFLLLLDEAFARGERVLVSNGIVFWYEPDGGVGWQVKETSSTRESDGATIWKEGTILSSNHGRLVVLPYIKENGEQVRGHTKNGPNDGRALPRHRDHYVEIPFSLYDGDLMIGLFGELPYE